MISLPRLRRLALLALALPLALAKGAAGAAPPAPAPAQTAYVLRQVILTENADALKDLNYDPAQGLVLVPAPLTEADRAELIRRLQAGENRVIDEKLLAAVAAVVEAYLRNRGFPMATAMVPPQNIAAGALRILIALGRVRSVKFEGNRWFSDSLLQAKLQIERGGLLRVSDLERSLAWTNSNPFRKMNLHVEPVPGTGEADLFFKVEERFPLRFSAGYENTGNTILGWDRYSAGLTYGNLWGADHLLSYQEMTSRSPRLLRAQTVEYRAPLPWRHLFSLSGSQVRVNPTFFDGLFTQVGRNLNVDARYAVPFRRGAWEGEITGTLSAKRLNNNLEFGGVPAVTSEIELFTASTGLAAIRGDRLGRWVLSGTFTASPGNLSRRNKTELFGDSRPGARPRYFIGHLWVQRQTVLAGSLIHTARLSTQFASARLVPSEQFSIGGANTIRGYEERILNGDAGAWFSHEVQKPLPAIPLGKRWPRLESTAVAFWDYGRSFIRQPRANEVPDAFLSSVGLGVRFSLGNYLSASAELGKQIERVEIPGAPSHRLHVKVSCSY
jgi:hemolysin activation/secretion protein